VRPLDQPEAAALARALSSASRRLLILEALTAAAVALPVGSGVHVLLRWAGLRPSASLSLGVLCTAVVLAAWLVRREGRWSSSAAARAIEGAYPASRNVVITAEELTRHPDRARPWIRTRVFESAASIVQEASPGAVAPMRNQVLRLLAAIAVSVALVGVSQRSISQNEVSVPPSAADARLRVTPGAIVATVTPPAYTGEAARTVMNPDRIEALQASSLRLAVEGEGAWRIRFGTDALNPEIDRGRTVVELALTRSGYIAVEPENDRTGEARRLVPVTVTADRAPTIRVEAPGKDLLLPDANALIRLATSATDDFGLQSLELRYTKASGSGEQFEFQEGSIPLAIARNDARNWKASAELALKRLGLGAGDTLIYRVLGRDGRPGDTGLATSDTFYIEVAGPGQVALEGFEMPPDRERFALSQQMIVLKLERLRARERSLDRAALEHEIANIAAEQRAVRSNFIFLMGGHVEDEEEEAAHSNEIQEGRLENTARKEIVTAIQHMTRAEQGMATVSTGAALPPARAAVEALQRAFGRNRYFLRTLPVRSRVDPSRRLTGELSAASAWQRELLPPAPDTRTQTARELLARLIDLSQSLQRGRGDAAARSARSGLTAMAEQALAVDPSSEEWRAISRALLRLRDGPSGDGSNVPSSLNLAVSLLATESRRTSLPVRPLDRENAALRSAWSEQRPWQ
jgi:hypothetical protein